MFINNYNFALKFLGISRIAAPDFGSVGREAPTTVGTGPNDGPDFAAVGGHVISPAILLEIRDAFKKMSGTQKNEGTQCNQRTMKFSIVQKTSQSSEQ